METNLITLDPKAVDFNDQGGMVKAFMFVESAKAKIRAFEETLQKESIKYFEEHPALKEIIMDDGRVLYKSHDKKERWNTEKVYDDFGFSMRQRAVLESNPNFRKTEIKKLTGLEDVAKEYMTVEWLDTVRLKCLDKKFIK